MTHGRSDAARAARRAITVWLAVIGLLIQLSASAACAIGDVSGAASATGAPFPICHAAGSDEAARQAGDRAPDHGSGHHEACPFCSVHCHAAVALAPSVPHVVPIGVAALALGSVPLVAATGVRVRAGASPRGPPPLA